jgi:hypothetical protein
MSGAAASTEAAPPFRPPLIPLAVTVALGVGIPYAAAYCTSIAGILAGSPVRGWSTLTYLYVQHGFQLLLALISIAALKKLQPGNYGLRLPERGSTYLGQALAWGLAFGVLMTLVDYAPELISGTTPRLDYPLTTGNVAGWLGFEGIYVGPTEEIPFRSLLWTYLAANMSGRLRFGRIDMAWAGVIIALIFALLHATNFATRPWPLALGQQIYAFALGVLYAYWLEKSRSVLAPAVGHNAGDVVEYAILFVWVGLG